MSLLPKSWIVFIDTNLKRVSDLQKLKEIIKNQFPKENANQIIADRIIEVPNLKKVVFPILNFEMYFIKNFLTSTECKSIIEMAEPHFLKSTVNSSTTVYEDLNFRSSSTCHLKSLPNQTFWNEMETKICNTVGLPACFSEPSQVQRYHCGNQFKLHADAFENVPKDHYVRGENRSWTFMIYLNDVPKGGETHFERLNVKIKPKAGMAVVWYNLLPNGHVNYDTVHEGLPVLEGKKYIITKWFRQKPIY